MISVLVRVDKLFSSRKNLRWLYQEKTTANEQKQKTGSEACTDAQTHPVLFSMSRIGDEVADFGAEVFPDGSTHVMN